MSDLLKLDHILIFRVSHCIECKMDASNLSKVFGPTIVQNSSANLEPMQMLQEAKWQPKVGRVGKIRAKRFTHEHVIRK